MKAIWGIFLIFGACSWADEPADSEAIRKAIATFNDPHQRATVLARDADLSPLGRFAGQEVSQVYFESTAIRLVTPDVAFVDAAASQYGSTIMKRTMPAVFVLKREGGTWRISVMRLAARGY
jgi:ketosteroid isomerase-like protein